MPKAQAIRVYREIFLSAAKADVAERDSVLSDRDLSDEGRTNRVSPIRDRMKKRFADKKIEFLGHLEESRKEYLRNLPSAIHRAAALQKPERAAAIMNLAAGLSPSELAEIVSVTAESRDAAAAYGLRQAILAGRERLGEDTVSNLTEELNKISTPAAERAIADYVACQVEYAQFLAGGEEGDPGAAVLADPHAVLSNAYSSVKLDNEDGTFRTLSDAERDRYCEEAGVPRLSIAA